MEGSERIISYIDENRLWMLDISKELGEIQEKLRTNESEEVEIDLIHKAEELHKRIMKDSMMVQLQIKLRMKEHELAAEEQGW